MACNSCGKGFSLLRKEKGCPDCGFSYCSKCVNNEVFVPKLNAKVKVCAKCKNRPCSNANENKQIIPPDAYYKRIAAMGEERSSSSSHNPKDHEILQRLQNLKTGSNEVGASKKVIEEDIAKRLQAIKGDVPSISDEELQIRLAKLRGHPSYLAPNKPVLPAPDVRTEQEQIDDLMKQYMEQSKIDSTYNEEFNEILKNIESRVQKLKGPSAPQPSTESQQNIESEDEEESVKKIIEKVKEESLLEYNSISPQTNEELPFCEICNEDAVMRCLGCKYLFCKRCFMEHKDDDDGCDSYEPFKPPKNH